MGYKVIHYFTDLQDFNHPYKVGDSFPRLGLNVSEDRLKELASKNNKQGKPLIKKVEDTKEDDFSQYMNPPEETKEVSYTKTEINRMPLDDLRKIAMNTGVDGAENMTGKELKEYLISVFGL